MKGKKTKKSARRAAEVSVVSEDPSTLMDTSETLPGMAASHGEPDFSKRFQAVDLTKAMPQLSRRAALMKGAEQRRARESTYVPAVSHLVDKMRTIKLQTWMDSPLLPKPLTMQSPEITGSTPPREWTDTDRFNKLQSFLHDKLLSRHEKWKFEGAHGMWELSVQKKHHAKFSPDTLSSVVDTVTCAVPGVQTCICGALWSLLATAALRETLIDMGLVEALVAMLARSLDPAFEEAWARQKPPPEPRTLHFKNDQRRVDRVLAEHQMLKLKWHLGNPLLYKWYPLGALSLLMFEPRARECMRRCILSESALTAPNNPVERVLLRLTNGHPPTGWHVLVHLASSSRNKRTEEMLKTVGETASEVLCNGLSRDPVGRIKFAGQGGILTMTLLLRSPSMRVQLYICAVLSLYCRTSRGQQMLASYDHLKALAEDLLPVIQGAADIVTGVQEAEASTHQQKTLDTAVELIQHASYTFMGVVKIVEVSSELPNQPGLLSMLYAAAMLAYNPAMAEYMMEQGVHQMMQALLVGPSRDIQHAAVAVISNLVVHEAPGPRGEHIYGPHRQPIVEQAMEYPLLQMAKDILEISSAEFTEYERQRDVATAITGTVMLLASVERERPRRELGEALLLITRFLNRDPPWHDAVKFAAATIWCYAREHNNRLKLGELGAFPILIPQFTSDTHLVCTELGHPSVEKLEFLTTASWLLLCEPENVQVLRNMEALPSPSAQSPTPVLSNAKGSSRRASRKHRRLSSTEATALLSKHANNLGDAETVMKVEGEVAPAVALAQPALQNCPSKISMTAVNNYILLERVVSTVAIKRYGPGIRDNLKLQCIKLLQTLVLCDRSFEEMLVRMHVGEALFEVTMDPLGMPVLRSTACALYLMLASRPEFAHTMGDRGKKETLIITLLESGDPLMMSNGMRFLARLAIQPDSKVKLVQKGCLEVVLRVARTAEAEGMLKLCLTAMLNLSTNSTNQVAICKLALPLLLYICRCNALTDELRQLAGSIVSNLSRHPGNRSLFYRAELAIKRTDIEEGFSLTLEDEADAVEPECLLPESSFYLPADTRAAFSGRSGRSGAASGRAGRLVSGRYRGGAADVTGGHPPSGQTGRVGTMLKHQGLTQAMARESTRVPPPKLPDPPPPPEDSAGDSSSAPAQQRWKGVQRRLVTIPDNEQSVRVGKVAGEADEDGQKDSSGAEGRGRGEGGREGEGTGVWVGGLAALATASMRKKKKEPRLNKWQQQQLRKQQFMQFSSDVASEETLGDWQRGGGLPNDLITYPKSDGLQQRSPTPEWVGRLQVDRPAATSLDSGLNTVSPTPSDIAGADALRLSLPPLHTHLRRPMDLIWKDQLHAPTADNNAWSPNIVDYLPRMPTLRRGRHRRRPHVGAELPPVDVVLGSEAASSRNVIHFREMGRVTRSKLDPTVVPPPTLLMFPHVDGCQTCSSLGLQHYVLPNGKVMHCYQAKRAIVDEIAVEADAHPEIPLHLDALGKQQLPEVAKFLHVFHDMPSGAHPDPYKSKPTPGPKPDRHSVHVTNSSWGCSLNDQSLLLFLEDEVLNVNHSADDLLDARPLPPPKTVMPPPAQTGFDPEGPGSAFAKRIEESDSRSIYDTEEVEAEMFKLDWQRLCSKENICRMLGDQIDQVREQCRHHSRMLYRVFYTFSAMGSGDILSMQLNEYSDFLTKCQLVEPGSKCACKPFPFSEPRHPKIARDYTPHVPYCKLSDCDKMFIQTNFQPDKKSAHAKNNPGNAIVRYEWIELMIRLAVAKYGKGQRTEDMADACAFLFMEGIPRNLEPDFHIVSNDFREQRFYTEAMSDLLKVHWDCLRKVYTYCRKRSKIDKHANGLLMDDFLLLLGDCDLWNLETGLPMREVKICYVHARMMHIDDLITKSGRRIDTLTMTFYDFLELLSRVADLLSVPTADELTDLGVQGYTEYVEAVRLAKFEPLMRRESAGILAPKTQPLNVKVENLINHLIRMLSEKLNAKNVKDLQKKLAKASKDQKKK